MKLEQTGSHICSDRRTVSSSFQIFERVNLEAELSRDSEPHCELGKSKELLYCWVARAE